VPTRVPHEQGCYKVLSKRDLASIGFRCVFAFKNDITALGGVHMCTYTSSAHARRFRHPHGVFTCVRVLHPSNMLNIEFILCLSVVLLLR